MFLRGLKDKFKYNSGLKFLKNELKSPAPVPDRPKGISAIGVIVDLDAFDKVERFQEIIEYFSLRPNAVKVIGYRNFYTMNSPYATPVFSDKDLGWHGLIDNSYANEFLSREYDLLLNYYSQSNLMLQLMSIKAKARLRVGLAEAEMEFNDLILKVRIEEFDTFMKELLKYLKVLKELA